NGYLKSRKYSYKFNIFKKVTSVSFIPNNIKTKKIKTGDDDDVNSQIKSIYGITRKEQPNYDESKAVEEIAELTDSNINKIVLLLTKSIYKNVTNDYLEIPKLLFFAQLLFENRLVISNEINDKTYTANPNFGIEFWKKNLNKSSYLKMFELIDDNAKLKLDLQYQNNKHFLSIFQGEFDSSPLMNESFLDYRNYYESCISDMNNHNRSSSSTNSQSSNSMQLDSDDEHILLDPEFQIEMEEIQNETERHHKENLKKQEYIPYTTNDEISYIINEVNVSDNMTAFIKKCKVAISKLEEDIFYNRINNNQFSDKIEDIQTFVKEFNIMFYKNWISELKKLKLYNNILNDMLEIFKNLQSNLMNLDKANKKLIESVKSKIENDYIKIVEDFNTIQEKMKN
ncbi:9627_t:CDS:2, partial [Racocetra persica]